MPTHILRAKLHIPYFDSHELIVRPRLSAKMNLGLTRKLTLVAASAGSGKSALVCQWLQELGIATAWLSLDQNDNHLGQFLRYLLAAIQQVHPQIGNELVQIIQTTESVDYEQVLSELLNEIDTTFDDNDNLILVLDDYHLISDEAVHQAMRYLLDYMPPALHIILTTRVDPPFPLGRMRVKRQLTEIRSADLRFTQDELRAYFAEVMQLDLTSNTVQQLEERTEGWIAGAQLAGLSLQGQKPAEAEQLLADLSGSDRYIADYLVDEVLQRQSSELRTFLLQTSILEKLSASLCDAVTEQGNSHHLLLELETNNFFLIPLDNERQWYRYHHLFQELLRAQLQFQQPESVTTLHQRACDWYAAQDLIPDALSHAFAAEDSERAADLIELSWRAMDRSFQEATWLGWVKKLPEELVRTRPVLSAGYGWALLDTGEIEAAEPRLRDAERWLELLDKEGDAGEEPRSSLSQVNEGGTAIKDMVIKDMVVVDEVEFRSLPATLAAARAYWAQASGDLPATEKYAQRTLDLLPKDDYFYRGIPIVTLGLAYWANGALEAAHGAFSRVGTQRTFSHFYERVSASPPPNRTCAFQRIRLSIESLTRHVVSTVTLGFDMTLDTECH